MITVYLDVCCLNRPFDDQSQTRIRLESEAVLIVLEKIQTEEWEWVRSSVLDLEIEQNPDSERRERTKLLTTAAKRRIVVKTEQQTRAQELVDLGFHAMDALHLACAESSGANVFLTTDDRLLKRATRVANKIKIRVMNPLAWVEEVSQ